MHALAAMRDDTGASWTHKGRTVEAAKDEEERQRLLTTGLMNCRPETLCLPRRSEEARHAAWQPTRPIALSLGRKPHHLVEFLRKPPPTLQVVGQGSADLEKIMSGSIRCRKYDSTAF